MTRFLAFLRAINVGGRTVKMDRLRALFESAGLVSVETFIASGNVAFSSPDPDARAHERRIEDHLRAALGFEVATFVRTAAELAAVAALQPFGAPEPDGSSLFIAFLPAPPDPQPQQDLLSRRTATDDFRVLGREVYWLCRGKISDSPFSGPLLEKTLALPATVRNANTVRKLAAKYPA